MWQAEALPTILHRLDTTGTATLHAAPGAGKTAFAGMVFHVLREADLLAGLVVVVPIGRCCGSGGTRCASWASPWTPGRRTALWSTPTPTASW